MKCENCLSRVVCNRILYSDNATCRYFKDKNLFVELPCKVGDVVYIFCEIEDNTIEISAEKVTEVSLKAIYTSSYNDEENSEYRIPLNRIGIDVFLTETEAEKALAERGNN